MTKSKTRNVKYHELIAEGYLKAFFGIFTDVLKLGRNKPSVPKNVELRMFAAAEFSQRFRDCALPVYDQNMLLKRFTAIEQKQFHNAQKLWAYLDRKDYWRLPNKQRKAVARKWFDLFEEDVRRAFY